MRLLAAAFALVAASVSVSNTAMAWCWPWEPGCTSDVATPWFDVNFKNNCREEIWVALKTYYPDNTWKDEGWWNIKPNETAFISRSINRNLYYYAYSNSFTWAGTATYGTLNGKNIGYNLTDMGGEFVNFTQSLSCN